MVPADIEARAAALLAEGLSPVYVAVDARVEGVGGIGDPVRADARATVDALRARASASSSSPATTRRSWRGWPPRSASPRTTRGAA